MRLTERLRRGTSFNGATANGKRGEKDQQSMTTTTTPIVLQRRLLVNPFSTSSSSSPTKSQPVKRKQSTSLTTTISTIQTGSSSKEFQQQQQQHLVEDVERSAISEQSKVQRKVISVDDDLNNDNDDCVLFHDDSNSNNHDDDDDDEEGKCHDVDGIAVVVENDNLSVDLKELLLKPQGLTTPTAAPATPDSRHRTTHLGPPSCLFLPPHEVTIDPYAVPPSPMRDPSVVFMALQEDQGGQLLNLGNQEHQQHLQRQYQAEYLYQLQPPELLGDPVGDIAMKRQLLDAHRLVRVILGKQVPSAADAPLETSTILHAIRSFALMKQELIDLRKRQEVNECDPPTILQSLGSPDTSATTTNGTKTPRTMGTSTSPSPRVDSLAAVGWKRMQQQPPVIPEQAYGTAMDSSSTDADADAAAAADAEQLRQAKSQIEILQQQLSAANETILKLQTEKILGRNIPVENSKECSESSERRVQRTPHIDFGMKYKRLVQDYTNSVAEAQRNLNLVLEEVASVPRRVLAKDSVREKLKVYVQTISQQTSKLEQVELYAQMYQSHEESNVRIRELEEQLLMQQRLQQQVVTMKGEGRMMLIGANSSTTITNKIGSRPLISTLIDGGDENNNNDCSSISYPMRVIQLQSRLFESQVETESLTHQIQCLQEERQLGGSSGKVDIDEKECCAELFQPENHILKEFSKDKISTTTSSRIPTPLTNQRLEVEDEKKIED